MAGQVEGQHGGGTAAGGEGAAPRQPGDEEDDAVDEGLHAAHQPRQVLRADGARVGSLRRRRVLRQGLHGRRAPERQVRNGMGRGVGVGVVRRTAGQVRNGMGRGWGGGGLFAVLQGK